MTLQELKELSEGVREERPEAQMVEVPDAPSMEELEQHRVHHANYEPWCPSCVAGQGREKPHRRNKKEKQEHVVYSDYMFFTKEGMKVSEPTEAQKKNKELVTVLTAIDQDSQAPFAVVVPSKGSIRSGSDLGLGQRLGLGQGHHPHRPRELFEPSVRKGEGQAGQ